MFTQEKLLNAAGMLGTFSPNTIPPYLERKKERNSLID
jgi:hypothetical protein